MDSTYATNLSFFLPDGRYEPMLNPEEDMARLIFEKMGSDAEKSFRILMSNCGSNGRADLASDVVDVCCGLLRLIDDIEGYLSCEIPDLSLVGKNLKKMEEDIYKMDSNAWNNM